MLDVVAAPETVIPRQRVPPPKSRWWDDAAVVLCYVLGTLYLLGPLLRHAGQAQLAVGGIDQTQEEWFLAHFAHALTHGFDPLYSTLGNSPLGINMMANASVMGLALPLTPVTLLSGPSVSFLVALGAGLSGSAAAWYFLLSRRLAVTRPAAALSGAFCGFAPAMVSHANGGHLNFVSQALIPVIVWRVLELRRPGRAVRNGALLALPVAGQFFVGAEPLLLAAIGIVLFVVAYAIVWPRVVMESWRPFLAGAAVAVPTGAALLAYPILWQFFGPQSFSGLVSASQMRNDVASWISFPGQSLGGFQPLPAFLAPNPTEENALFGWPLLILAAAAAVRLWRESPVARAAAITAVVALVVSLGSSVRVWGRETPIPGPWRLVERLPLFDIVLPSRIAMIAIPMIGVLLALAVVSLCRTEWPWRWGLVAAALIPLIPTPLPVTGRPEVPSFFTHGHWRRYVEPGRAIVSAIPFDNTYAEPMRWQIAAGMEFRNAGGYFVGPVGDHGQGWYAPDDRRFTTLLREIAERGEPVAVSPEVRREIVSDLHYWRADAIVLAVRHEPLRRSLDALVGPGKEVGGVHVWGLRDRG